jgi:hypothetical protein
MFRIRILQNCILVLKKVLLRDKILRIRLYIFVLLARNKLQQEKSKKSKLGISLKYIKASKITNA